MNFYDPAYPETPSPQMSDRIDLSLRDLTNLLGDAANGCAGRHEPLVVAEALAPYVTALGRDSQIARLATLTERAVDLTER